MSDYTETISLADVKLGDRWIGVSQILPTINESTPTNDLTRVVLSFRLGQTTFVLDSDDAEITIDDANTWACSIAAMDTFLPRAGKWEWDMAFYQETYDSPWTLYSGALRVWPDVS